MNLNPIQIAVLALGAIFAITGIALFAKRGVSGKNTIKIGEMEFQLAGSSLVVFVLGCGLVVVAARLETKSAAESATKEVAKSTAPTPTPSPSLESAPPRDFLADFVYRADMIERTEYATESDVFPAEKIGEFLRVKRVVFGRDKERRKIFQITVTIKNTTKAPIQLDLTERFFNLRDDHGAAARLIYFCCASQGDLLSPGQEREIELFYQSERWEGKNMTARQIFFTVEGLLPIVRATWKFPTLATAA